MCVDLFFLIHQVFNKTESLACMCLTELLSYSLILKVQKKKKHQKNGLPTKIWFSNLSYPVDYLYSFSALFSFLRFPVASVSTYTLSHAGKLQSISRYTYKINYRQHTCLVNAITSRLTILPSEGGVCGAVYSWAGFCCCRKGYATCLRHKVAYGALVVSSIWVA